MKTFGRGGPGSAIRLLDAAGICLLAVLLTRLFFDLNPPLDHLPIAFCAVGILGAVVAGDLRTTPIDWPLGLYAVLAVISVLVQDHTPAAAPFGSDSPLSERHPGVHVAVLVAYFYGAVWVLRTPRRLAVLAVFFVVVVSLFGVQTSLDHIAVGLSTRMKTFPSVPQWGGYPELGVLAVLGWPFVLAVVMLSRSCAAIVAATVIACVLCVTTLGLHSRSADLTLGVTSLGLAVVEAAKLGRYRLFVATCAFVCLAAAFWMTHPLQLTPEVPSLLSAMRLRYALWRNALAMIGDHRWLGVGAGSYTASLRSAYVTSADPADAHAHSMILHVAAESGIPALIAFLVVWWRVLRLGCTGSLQRDVSGILKIGSFGALAAFFIRSTNDHFLNGLPSSDRMGFVVWTLLAGAIALERSSQIQSRPRSNVSRVGVHLNQRSAVVDG